MIFSLDSSEFGAVRAKHQEKMITTSELTLERDPYQALTV